MKIVSKIEDLRKLIPDAKMRGKTIGLVPTMGALHDGHMSLVRAARESGDFVVVSIFVNPTQFGPNEDFRRYPRTFEADSAKCAEAGVDIIFAPNTEEMYPDGFSTFVDVEGITTKLEGTSRPGHFTGVATVVLKLFAAVEPTRAYFGMKDYQQLKVIEKMVRDLNVKVEVVPVPTLREPDGLAMSSRNAYLRPDERKAATVLYRSLSKAKEMADSGEKDAQAIWNAVTEIIDAEPLAEIDYVAVCHPQTLEMLDSIEGGALVALAVRMGKTRLIDNIVLGGARG
jgi:pantoate--beta-alanine ligase